MNAPKPPAVPSREKTPKGSRWSRIPDPTTETRSGTVAISFWRKDNTIVSSELAFADLPGREGKGLQWLVAISNLTTGRAGRDVVREVLRDFGMRGAEEDNHHPGIARHFWLVVDRRDRVECECKTDETVITEPGGYRWTTPTDGPCRGCELELATGFPCTIHRPGADALPTRAPPAR